MSRKSRRGGGVVALLQAQNKLLEERLARQDAAIAALARVEPAVTTVLPPPTLRELEAGLAAQAQAQVGGSQVKLGRRRVHVFTADLQVPDPAGDQVAGADKIRVVLPGGTQAQAEVSLAKSARRELESAAPGSIERLAFDQDPNAGQGYEGVYIPKRKLVPDDICKRIAIVEDLVACIVGGRAFQMSHFGKPRPDRFSFGFVIQPTPAQLAKMSPQEREALEAKIDKAVNRLYHCGDEEGWDHSDRMTLSEWLFQSARNAVTVGRLATEIISTRDPLTDELRFRGFRPVDAGSIYRAAPQAAHATETVREQSRTLLENVKGHKFDADRFDVKNAPGNFFERWDADEFRWVQVIESRPVQVFTDAEMRCKNLYSVLDWETNGYPVTPIDNAYVAISTRLNITTHNKNYFLHGRASRGMLVIQSEDVDEAVIKDLKQHLQANVNGVGNAWRMPVFGVGQNDKVTWCPFDQGTKDMEFQYLSDNNSRTILSVFQMSPEEIPGYSHLSRGSNSQALSECLTYTTWVWTPQGRRTLGEILGDADERRFRVWTGLTWEDARVYKVGLRHLRETELACGLVVSTSPDHRYKVVGEDGEPCWRTQENLVVGDYVLINRLPVQGDVAAIPSYKGQKLTLEMMELLGWMTGDGTLIGPKPRAGGYVKLFYQHHNERDMWELHHRQLCDFGLTPRPPREDHISEEEAAEIAEERGFNSVSTVKITNVLYSNEFVGWLFLLGFTPSSRKPGLGKCIPDFIHALPWEYRAAFLRGLFSADGGKLNERGHVALTMHSDKIREGARQLLLGLGIRVQRCGGLLVESFGQKRWSPKLFVKDRDLFWERVGFVQQRKQLEGLPERGGGNHYEAPLSVTAKLARAILDAVPRRNPHSTGEALLDKKERSNLNTVARGARTSTLRLLFEQSERCGVQVPGWLKEFHIEQVVELREPLRMVEMVDVEVYDDQHGFIGSGTYVHNSNQEYRLEAHRDLGIRPLIGFFEDFINTELLPLVAPDLVGLCQVKLDGLEADTAEKEAVRIQQDLVHSTYNEVLHRTEKRPIGKDLAGDVPLNQQWQATADKLALIGHVRERLMGDEHAKDDIAWRYARDPFWFQQQDSIQKLLMALPQMFGPQAIPQLAPPLIRAIFPYVNEQGGKELAQMMAQNIMQQMQQQAAEQAAQAGQAPPGGQEGGGGGAEQEGGGEEPQEQAGDDSGGQEGGEPAQPAQGGEDLTRSLDQAIAAMSKGEAQLPPAKRKILRQHRRFVQQTVASLDRELGDLLGDKN